MSELNRKRRESVRAMNQKMRQKQNEIIEKYYPYEITCKPLTEDQVDAVYAYAAQSRNSVKWEEDESGNKINFSFSSIDAWRE